MMMLKTRLEGIRENLHMVLKAKYFDEEELCVYDDNLL